jgi:hypothetical protein
MNIIQKYVQTDYVSNILSFGVISIILYVAAPNLQMGFQPKTFPGLYFVQNIKISILSFFIFWLHPTFCVVVILVDIALCPLVFCLKITLQMLS